MILCSAFVMVGDDHPPWEQCLRFLGCYSALIAAQKCIKYEGKIGLQAKSILSVLLTEK